MKVLIVYGTTEGHTRDLCSFIAEALSDRGAQVTQVEASPNAPSPDGFDVCFVAASLHMARYQPEVIEYAMRQRNALSQSRAAFVSVSLAAAGENPQDWAGLEECVAALRGETGWIPIKVEHVAGAIRYSHYDFFKRLALQYIARRHGKKTVTSRDYDLTDYDALRRFATDFVFGSANDVITVSPAQRQLPEEAPHSAA